MGCDIHMKAEVFWDGEWHLVDNPIFRSCYEGFNNDVYDGRNYTLFGVLEDGVRSYDYPAISEAKGWPHDLSEGGEKFREECDGWTWGASWLGLDELLNYDWCDEFNQVIDEFWFFHRYSIGALKLLIPPEGGASDVRIIFCFDS